ncbi:MAG: hypothetical protein E7179_06400 [Erysipelotrichaceae bacterium]|jgi:hypothetical protein|nr:hypothetical protein [Erysipelotrichaceae bacterium]
MKLFKKSILILAPALLLASCGGGGQSSSPTQAWQGENVVNAEFVKANIGVQNAVKPISAISAKEARVFKSADIVNTDQLQNSGMMIVKETVGEGVDAKTLYGVYDIIHGSYVINPSIENADNIRITRDGNGARYILGNSSTTWIGCYHIRVEHEVEVEGVKVPFIRIIDRYGHVIGDYQKDLFSGYGNLVYYEFVKNSGKTNEKIERFWEVVHKEDAKEETIYEYFKYSQDMSKLEKVSGFGEFAPENWEKGDLVGAYDLGQYGKQGLRVYGHTNGTQRNVWSFVDDQNAPVYDFVFDASRTAILGAVGGVLNYQVREQLPKDASDYKFSLGGEKFDYHTYSIDMTKWETKEIENYPYVFINTGNAVPKSFFANAADAEAKKYSYSLFNAYEVDTGKKVLKAGHTLLLDGELKVRGDITTMDFANNGISMIGNNFLIGSRVYDGKSLAQIGSISGSRLASTDDKVYYSFSDGNQVGVMDGTGKVVVKPAYRNLFPFVQNGKIYAQKFLGGSYVLLDLDSGKETAQYDRGWGYSNSYDHLYKRHQTTEVVEAIEKVTYHFDLDVFGTETKLESDSDSFSTYAMNYGDGYSGVDWSRRMVYITYDKTVEVNEEEQVQRHYVVVGGSTTATVTPYTFTASEVA